MQVSVNPLLMLYQYKPLEKMKFIVVILASEYEQGIVKEEEEEEEETDYETDKQIEASGFIGPSPNSLIERLELLILETKAGHDGLYDEMLDISKQLLSMNIINQEQLKNFVFNYGK